MFEAMFESFWYQGFMLVFAGLALFLIPLVFFFGIKNKNKVLSCFWTVVLVFLLFVVYESVPYYYTLKAMTASDKNEIAKNYKKAIDSAIFPEHKGVLYLNMSERYAAMGYGREAIESYEKAYMYHKTYDKSHDIMAGLLYTADENYTKAIKIYEKYDEYAMIAYIYTLEGDYNKALEYADKQIQIKPTLAAYERSAIAYRYLGEKDLADKDFRKALDFCKNDSCKTALRKRYNGYKTYITDQHNLARKNYHIEEK